MKNYKEFSIVNIGNSTINSLIVRSVHKVAPLFFIEDGPYSAYECFGDVEIDSSFCSVFEADFWLKIYDDDGLVYYHHSCDSHRKFRKVTVYKSWEMECIIHWHN